MTQFKLSLQTLPLIFQTSPVKFPYEYLSILSIDKVNKNATYQCEAKNAHGEDRASVVVEAVIKKYFYMTEEPKGKFNY